MVEECMPSMPVTLGLIPNTANNNNSNNNTAGRKGTIEKLLLLHPAIALKNNA
jgi:hypothetical protein